MFRKRIAMVGVLIVAALATASVASADNNGPPKPNLTGHEGAAVVCHGYPGATSSNKNGTQGTPDGTFCEQ